MDAGFAGGVWIYRSNLLESKRQSHLYDTPPIYIAGGGGSNIFLVQYIQQIHKFTNSPLGTRMDAGFLDLLENLLGFLTDKSFIMTSKSFTTEYTSPNNKNHHSMYMCFSGSRADNAGHVAHLVTAVRYGSGGRPPWVLRLSVPWTSGGIGAMCSPFGRLCTLGVLSCRIYSLR